jgi:molybdopterin-guanine dinucleotide biosynthesis protein A
VSVIDGIYHAVYLGADDYGIGFVIAVDAPWVSDELREILDSLLDDPLHLTAHTST